MSGKLGIGYFYRLLAMTGTSSPPWMVAAAANSWLILDSQLEFIDDGHPFMITRPQETAQVIERFPSAARSLRAGFIRES